MQPYIHSYTMFFIVFFSVFLLAIVMDWMSRKYNLSWLRTGMENHCDKQDDSELKQELRSLQAKLERIENKLDAGNR